MTTIPEASKVVNPWELPRGHWATRMTFAEGSRLKAEGTSTSLQPLALSLQQGNPHRATVPLCHLRTFLFLAALSLAMLVSPRSGFAGEIVLDESQKDPVTSAFITDGTIINVDISGSAAIADSKLATISTAGKVADSALSATVTKLGGAIDLATSEVAGTLPVASGGIGTTTGSITGTGALTFTAGGTNQNVTLTPSGTGKTILNGNVGIGTTSPAAKLEVVGNQLRISSTGGSYRRIIFFDSLGTPTKYNFQIAQQEVNNALHIGPSTAVGGTIFSGSTGMVTNSSGNVGIGTATPAATALLDMTSTTKGFLPPRMTTTQRDAVSSPATGLFIYNTTSKEYNLFDGTLWRAVDSHEGGVTNFLANGSFESWSGGTSVVPDGWTLTGVGSLIAKETTTVRHSSASAKPNTNGTNEAVLDQSLYDVYFQGRQMTLLVWANASAATRVRVALYDTDGVNEERTYSDYHSGTPGWEKLTVSKTIQADATDIKAELRVETGVALSVFFDGVVAMEGVSSHTGFAPKALTDTGTQTLYGDLQLESPSGGNVSLTALRGAAIDTAIRWNEALARWEYTNDGSTYSPFAAASGGWHETFTASASQTIFTLTAGTYNPGTNGILVFYNGVLQQVGAGNDYVETNSSTITFNSGGTSGRKVVVMSKQGLTAGTSLPVGSATATTDSSANASILINDTGGGNLLQLQVSGVDKFTIDNTGAVTTSGALTLPANGLTVGTTQLVAASGNIGIGTASPGVLLDLVQGSGTAQIRVSQGARSTVIQADGTDSYIGASTNNKLHLLTNNTQKLTIDTSGNVGIGTTSPKSKLHVGTGSILGDESFGTFLSYNAYYQGGWKYNAADEAGGIAFDTGGSIILRNAALGTAGGALTWVDRLTIQADGDVIVNSGNVGIGTTSPGAKLDVAGQVKITGSPIPLLLTASSPIIDAPTGTMTFDAANFQFRQRAGANPRLHIVGSSGNVGIGTTSPNFKLQVGGYPVVSAQLWGASSWSQSGLVAFSAGSVNDGSTTSAGFHTDTSAAGSYLQLDAGSAKAFTGVAIFSGRVVPQANISKWDVQYSDDAVGWTTVYTGIDLTTNMGGWREVRWQVKNVNPAHRYWRLSKTNAAAGGDYVYEVQFFEGPAEHGVVRTDASGNVGIGTTSPGAKLDIAGNVKIADGTQGSGKVLTSDASGVANWQTVPPGVPAGGVMFFNLTACPSGWTELTSARGRYAVGLPLSGTLAGTAGTALTNQENRAVGQHNHGVSDPTHTHSVRVQNAGGTADTKVARQTEQGSTADVSGAALGASTGISVNNAGSVAGTNAPYIQLLACQKS